MSVCQMKRVKRTRQMKRSGRWIDLADPADETVRQTRRQRKRSGRPGRRNGPADQLKPAVVKTHGTMTQIFEFKIIYPSLYQPVCLYVCLSIIDNSLNMKVYIGTAETTRQMTGPDKDTCRSWSDRAVITCVGLLILKGSIIVITVKIFVTI